MNDCFERHDIALRRKMDELKELGINSWTNALATDDPELERECFVEFHRRKVEEWRKECPHRVWRIRKGSFSEAGLLLLEREKIKPDTEISFSAGEFPVATFKGKGSVFQTPQPPDIFTGHLYNSDRDLIVVVGATSKNPHKYLRAAFDYYQKKTREGFVTFKDGRTGKRITRAIHDSSCESCRDKIKSEGEIVGEAMSESAVEGVQAANYLREPLEFLDTLEGAQREQVARLLERAYHAGMHGFKARHSKALMTDAAFEMEDQSNKRGPRKVWTKEARNFFQIHSKSKKWWEVLEHLKAKNLAHWEAKDGGDCGAKKAFLITFEEVDAGDKDRRQFQNALSEIRKKISE